MTHINREAVVPHGCDRMFDLVMDVERYPEFLRYCRGAEILERGEREVTARLDLAKGPVHQSFTTRNRYEPGRWITLALVDGPFSRLSGSWRFEPINDASCRICLELDYEVKGSSLKFLVERVVSEVANQMLDAMVDRARRLYAEEDNRQ